MDDSSILPSGLSDQAIEAAMETRWEEALKLNRQIIKLDPGNVDALNRQARAYMELGKFNLARKYYSEALKFDPYNPIALKNLKIIKAFKTKSRNLPTNGQDRVTASLFLQEPGKTKVVSLLNVAEPKMLSQAFCGMRVEMVVKNRKVIIIDSNGSYFGVLPDDICHHLIRLLRGGNKYQAFIKSIRVNALSVLIKETFRSKRFKNQPSFLDSSTNLSETLIVYSSDSEDSQEEADGEAEEQQV